MAKNTKSVLDCVRKGCYGKPLFVTPGAKVESWGEVPPPNKETAFTLTKHVNGVLREINKYVVSALSQIGGIGDSVETPAKQDNQNLLVLLSDNKWLALNIRQNIEVLVNTLGE